MHILHIMAGKGLGGAETYSADVILSLHRAGVSQCVVMDRKAPRYADLEAAGLRMAPHVLAVPFRPWQRWRLSRLIRREKPDIVHCWMRRAASLVRKKGQGGKGSRAVIGWFGGYYEPKHFRACTHFVGVTRGIVAHMAEKGVVPDRAFFIPTFPDIDDTPPADRRTLDTPPDAKAVLVLSRLHPKKGIDTLLQALKELPRCHAWIAGEGPLRHELEKLAVSLGVKDRAHFLGWRNDRAALLRAADACALPSRYEPFGTVILEAWAARTPLVACASAGPSGTVEDGRTGLLVPIDDARALAASLRRAFEDQPLRRRLIEQGYEAYQKDYTREAVTRQWLAFYARLTSVSRQPATAKEQA